MGWVDKKTGDVVDVPDLINGVIEDYEEVPDWEYLSLAEFELGPDAEIPNREWVPGHFLKKEAHFDAEDAALDAAYKAAKSRVRNSRACLHFRYKAEVEAIVSELLWEQRGKKKSVILDYGVCGYRKDTKIVVEKDQAETIAWLFEHGYDEAVKTSYSVLKRDLPKGEEIPGVTWPGDDVFYARPAK